MLDDSLTPELFERLLSALLALPPPQSSQPHHSQLSPHEAGDGAAPLVLEVIDMALHTPPAWPQRMAAVRYFCKHARHRLGLHALRDLQALLEQYPQGEHGDDELARLLWNGQARGHVRALRVLAWFMATYDITELSQWHAWMGTAGGEEALRESLETLGALAVVLLWQAKSGRTDHAWVLRFARRALGRSISEGPALLAFRDIAGAMGESQLALARRVAQLEREALGIEDAPSMRVLWWQCAAKELERQIAFEGNEPSENTKGTNATADVDEWCTHLSPAPALRHGEAGVTLERQWRPWPRTAKPMLTALRLRQRGWSQGLGLWLEIEGEGMLPAVHQMAIANRFEAAGLKAPQLQYMSDASGTPVTWRATWQWEEALWMPKAMVLGEARRWAQDTALKATEHWLLLRGMVARVGTPVAHGTKMETIDVKMQASNEKKF